MCTVPADKWSKIIFILKFLKNGIHCWRSSFVICISCYSKYLKFGWCARMLNPFWKPFTNFVNFIVMVELGTYTFANSKFEHSHLDHFPNIKINVCKSRRWYTHIFRAAALSLSVSLPLFPTAHRIIWVFFEFFTVNNCVSEWVRVLEELLT